MVSITIIVLIFNYYSTNAIAQDIKPQTILNLANKNYLAGKLESAKENIQTLLKSDPENRNLLYNLGVIEYRRNNLNKAIGYLTYSYIKGNKRAFSFLRSIQNEANFSIHKKSMLDKVLNIPLNVFLGLFILIWIINQTINTHNKILNFKRSWLSWAAIFACMCIIFIKVRKDTEIWAVSIYETSLYVAPNEQSAPIMELTIGTKAVIKQTTDLWHLVSVDNKQGFVLKKHLFYPEKTLNENT